MSSFNLTVGVDHNELDDMDDIGIINRLSRLEDLDGILSGDELVGHNEAWRKGVTHDNRRGNRCNLSGIGSHVDRGSNRRGNVGGRLLDSNGSDLLDGGRGV